MKTCVVYAVASLSLGIPSSASAQDKPFLEVVATGGLGTGLRFNNPFRLATPLGRSAESVSRIATFTDLGVWGILRTGGIVSHGAALRLSLALTGTPQSVATPSYVLYHRKGALAGYARLGLPIVLYPESTWGGELAFGGAYFLRRGLGFFGEGGASVYFGAATPDVRVTTIPVLWGIAGVAFSLEFLP